MFLKFFHPFGVGCSCFSSSPVLVERFSDSASLGLFERFATGCHLSQPPHSYSDGFLLLCRNAHRRALCSRFSASLVLAELFPVKRLLGCPSGLLSLSNSLVTLTPQNFARPTTFVTPEGILAATMKRPVRMMHVLQRHAARIRRGFVDRTAA